MSTIIILNVKLRVVVKSITTYYSDLEEVNVASAANTSSISIVEPAVTPLATIPSKAQR